MNQQSVPSVSAVNLLLEVTSVKKLIGHDLPSTTSTVCFVFILNIIIFSVENTAKFLAIPVFDLRFVFRYSVFSHNYSNN